MSSGVARPSHLLWIHHHQRLGFSVRSTGPPPQWISRSISLYTESSWSQLEKSQSCVTKAEAMAIETGRSESWWRDQRRERLWSESEVEIGGDWRKKKKKEEVQLKPWRCGHGMEVGGLVGLRSRTLSDWWIIYFWIIYFILNFRWFYILNWLF